MYHFSVIMRPKARCWIKARNGAWSQTPDMVSMVNIIGSIGTVRPALISNTISVLREGFGFSRIRLTKWVRRAISF
jgi:hypothetical protein